MPAGIEGIRKAAGPQHATIISKDIMVPMRATVYLDRLQPSHAVLPVVPGV